jgi:hypothetical protein
MRNNRVRSTNFDPQRCATRRARFRMQMKTDVESMHWIIALLVLIALGVAVIVYVALSLPGAKLGGGFFLAIGALNMMFYKSTGRMFFAKTQSSPPFVASFWAHGGERETQLLFLGIGLILAVAGCILLVPGSVQKRQASQMVCVLGG